MSKIASEGGSYTEAQETFLKNEMRNSKYMCWVHERSHRACRRYHYMLIIPSIIVTALVAAMEFTSEAHTPTQPQEKHYFSGVVLGACSLTGSILTSISGVFRYTDKASSHRSTAKSYQRLIGMLQSHLLTQKDTFDEVLRDLIGTKDGIQELALVPQMSAIKEFALTFNESDVQSLPIILRTSLEDMQRQGRLRRVLTWCNDF